jgi:hypothetical protein
LEEKRHVGGKASHGRRKSAEVAHEVSMAVKRRAHFIASRSSTFAARDNTHAGAAGVFLAFHAPKADTTYPLLFSVRKVLRPLNPKGQNGSEVGI